jgi:hypothetical protein
MIVGDFTGFDQDRPSSLEIDDHELFHKPTTAPSFL